jgi:hypothetical protein
MTLIVELDYFAPSIFYYKLIQITHCVFDIYEPYQKMTFRNRCTLSGANGIIHLSVPLIQGRGQRTIMRDVRIMNKENWQSRHWKTITSVFNKSPWFSFYHDEMVVLYNKKFDFLVDWNLACFEWIADKMAIKAATSLSKEPIINPDPNEYKDWRNYMRPSTINAINPNPARYPQVFEERFGFIPNLSILDYLFCAGNRL